MTELHPPPAPRLAPPLSPTVRAMTGAARAPWIATLIAAGAAILGALLPWASLGVLSAAGTDGDGMITLLLGVAAGIVAIAARYAVTAWSIVAIATGALVVAVAVYDINEVTSTAGVLGIEPSVGSGLWITLLAGLVLGGSGIVALVRKRRPKV